MTTTTLNTCGYGCNDFDLEPHEMCAMCRNRLPTMTTTDTRTNLINSLESALQDEWCTLTTRSTNYAARVVIQGRIAKLRARLVAACKAQHAAPIAPRGEDYKCVGICDALPLDDATFIYEPSYNIIMDCDRYEAQTRISKAQHSTPITPRGEDYEIGVTGETLLGGCYTPVGSLTLAAAIASDCINHESRSMWGHAVG
jgi:hypothetical protein